MELLKETELKRPLSWGSIMAGVVTVMAVSLLLTTLGSILGFSLLSPQSDDVINGADKAVLFWSVILIGLRRFVAGWRALMEPSMVFSHGPHLYFLLPCWVSPPPPALCTWREAPLARQHLPQVLQ